MPDLLAGTTVLAQDTLPAVLGRETATFENFSSVAFVATSPACEVTFVAPTTGRVRIEVAIRWDSDNAGEQIQSSVQVRETDGSGTVVHFPDTNTGEGVSDVHPAAAAGFVNRTGWVYLSGLTPGATYWAQMRHNTGGTQADIAEQVLLVTPLS